MAAYRDEEKVLRSRWCESSVVLHESFLPQAAGFWLSQPANEVPARIMPNVEHWAIRMF